MGKGLFITGTDTGVGKTLVSVGLITLLKERGMRVGVMKPVESGCRREDGGLIPEDATLLRDAADSQEDLDIINPYALEAPLAPALAADVEGIFVCRLACCGCGDDPAVGSADVFCAGFDWAI